MKTIERFFINFDKLSHFVPILSSIASLVNLVEKAFMFIFKIDKPKSHYFAHIKNQPNWVTVVCFFPIIGNAAYIIYKCKSKPEIPIQEGQENPNPVIQQDSNLIVQQDPNLIIKENLDDQVLNELNIDDPIESKPLTIPQLQEKMLDVLQNEELKPTKRRKNFFKMYDNLGEEAKKELLTLEFLNACYLKHEEQNANPSSFVVPKLLEETGPEVIKVFLENKLTSVKSQKLSRLIECFKSSPKEILELFLTEEKIYDNFKTPGSLSLFFPYIPIETATSLALKFNGRRLNIILKNLSPALQNQLVDVDFLDEKITYKGEEENLWLLCIVNDYLDYAKLLTYATSQNNIVFFNRILERAPDEKTKTNTIRAIELILPHLNRNAVKELFLHDTFLSLLADSEKGKDLIIQYAEDEHLEKWIKQEEFDQHAKALILTTTPDRILKYLKLNEKEVEFLQKTLLECINVDDIHGDSQRNDTFKNKAQAMLKNFWPTLSPEKKEEVVDCGFLKNCFMEEKNTCRYQDVLLPAIFKDASILEIKTFTEFLASENVSLDLLLDTLLKSLPPEKCKIIDSDLFEKIKNAYNIPIPITARSITLFLPYATEEFKKEKAKEVLENEKYDQDMVRFFAALDKDMQKEFVDSACLEKYFTPENPQKLQLSIQKENRSEMVKIIKFSSSTEIVKFLDRTLQTASAQEIIESLPFLLPELDEEVREFIFQQKNILSRLAQDHPTLFLKFASDEVVDKWISFEKQKEWFPHALLEMKPERAQRYLRSDNLEQARAWIQINPDNLQFFDKEVALVLLEEDANWFPHLLEELKKDEECLELSFKSLLQQERIEISNHQHISYQELKIWIRYDLLEKNPLIVVDLFTQINTPFPNEIHVHFLYPDGKAMEGIDRGGLSRNLFSKLIPALASTLFNEKAKTLDKDVYTTFGKLLAIAYNNKYPVGPAFLKYFYKLLTGLRDSNEGRILKAYRNLHTETGKNIDIELINQIIDIKHLIEENKKLLNKPEIQENMDWDDIAVESDLAKYTEQRFIFVLYLNILFSKQPNLTPDWWDSENIEEDKFLYEHGEEIASSIKLNQVNSILNTLKKEAVEEIKKGEFADLATAFFESVPSIPPISTENLIAQLEGMRVSSESLKVLFKIENPTLKQWVEQWLDENQEDPKQLEDFLWATTSSRSIIPFDPQPSCEFIIGKASHVTFSSCNNLCKINEDLVKDYEQFKRKLSETIVMVLKDPFSMG